MLSFSVALPLGMVVLCKPEGCVVSFLCAILCSAIGLSILPSRLVVLKRVSFLLVLAGSGIASGSLASFRMRKEAPYAGLPISQVDAFSGVLLNDGSRLPSGGYRYLLRLSSVSGSMGRVACGKGLVQCYTEKPFAGGWGYRVSCPVRLSDNSSSPGISLTAKGAETAVVEPIFPWLALRLSVRDAIRLRCQSFGQHGSVLFTALILGERDDPHDADFLLFTSSGTVHVLALSGLHLGILSNFLGLLLAPLFGKRISCGLSLCLITLYTFIAGPFPSLLRAFLMFAMRGLLSLGGRKAGGLHILTCSFIVLVSLRPDFLFSLSTQLSFLALCGIFVMTPFLDVMTRQYLPRSVGSSLGSSIGAFFFTLPVIAHTFGVVYPIGIIATLAIVPLVTAFIWSGLVLLPLSMIHVDWLSSSINGCMEALYNLLIRVAGAFSLFPALEVTGATLLALYCGFGVLYGTMWMFLRRHPLRTGFDG
ncbi:MAG TPA: ComEC/Rec2 family competence protein [Spirochaetia bacterium]|nr:ComEC/Rec2 family competence protein [Spirochaetia bacterium]